MNSILSWFTIIGIITSILVCSLVCYKTIEWIDDLNEILRWRCHMIENHVYATMIDLEVHKDTVMTLIENKQNKEKKK